MGQRRSVNKQSQRLLPILEKKSIGHRRKSLGSQLSSSLNVHTDSAPVMIVILIRSSVDAHEVGSRECRAQHSNNRATRRQMLFFSSLPLWGDSNHLSEVMGQMIRISVEFKRTSESRASKSYESTENTRLLFQKAKLKKTLFLTLFVF